MAFKRMSSSFWQNNKIKWQNTDTINADISSSWLKRRRQRSGRWRDTACFIMAPEIMLSIWELVVLPSYITLLICCRLWLHPKKAHIDTAHCMSASHQSCQKHSTAAAGMSIQQPCLLNTLQPMTREGKLLIYSWTPCSYTKIFPLLYLR